MSDSRVRHVTGRGIVLRGADIDTDRIIPARYLKTVTFEGLERGLFADDREALGQTDVQHPFDREDFAGARILIVNHNFGCGSSREHAPQALYRWGIRAVVGESFAEIFFSNAVMLGLPCVNLSGDHIQALMAAVEAAPAGELTVDVEHDRVATAGCVWPSSMAPHAKDALTSGRWDGAGLLLEHYEVVEALAATLPY
jgi:3-isopropylmalate/(R)-2-methylmalate dehydratase small subunit